MEQLRKLAATLSARQRWSILVAVLLVGAGLFAFTRWRAEAAFRPLYTALAPEDAGAVVARLKQANVEYRLAENGTAVLVPENRLSELRLEMAVEGLPKSGRMGFEIFDQTNFGLTDFAEHVNYRRALEGELERSLGHMAEVEQARVHLTFPKDSVFLEARQPAKASVMLRLRAGASLSAQNVHAICHLAASAVEGLAPESVSVLDTRGNLLNRPRPAAPADEMAASAAALDYRRQIERELALKIRATLDPLLGPDRFQAAVSVECDLTSGEQSEETFDPERSVMLASQKTEDSTGGVSTSGIPGTASNLPRAAAPSAAGRVGVSRRTENVTYQSSRVVKRTRRPQGVVNRISVALLLDQEAAWEGEPPAMRRVLAPPAPEKLKAVRDLVAGVVGLDAQRGDQIVVESLPFEATLRAAPPPAPGAPPSPAAAPGRPPWPPDPRLLVMAGAGAAALLVLVVAAWIFSRRKRKKPAPPSIPGALPQGASGAQAGPGLQERMESQLADQDAARQRLEMEVLRSLKAPEAGSTKKSEVLAKHLRENIAKDANPSVMVLRGWLNG